MPIIAKARLAKSAGEFFFTAAMTPAGIPTTIAIPIEANPSISETGKESEMTS